MQTQGTTTPPNRLAELREAKGLIRSEVAGHLRIDQTTLYRWERGATTIPDDAKTKLAKLFGVTRAYLMRWEDDEPEVAA